MKYFELLDPFHMFVTWYIINVNYVSTLKTFTKKQLFSFFISLLTWYTRLYLHRKSLMLNTWIWFLYFAEHTKVDTFGD